MEQSTALNILKAGHNVFLTGSAGTGKSYTLKQYIQYLRKKRIPVAVTASTGIAAAQLNGSTIHAWAGIGIKDYLTQRDVDKVKNNRFKYEAIMKTRVLIIDEISMLHARQLEMVDTMMRRVKDVDLPFGGLQVIFTGDFFQLPPVGTEGETNRDKFCFMSLAWLHANLHVCYLDKQYRQAEGPLIDILNSIRAQDVSEEQIELLRQTDFNDELDENPLHLFTHNLNVDLVNNRALHQLGGELETFIAETTGHERLLEALMANIRAPATLELKVGAKVMFVKNHPDGTYANGTQGIVHSFRMIDGKKIPIVETKKSGLILARPEEWAFEDERGKPVATFTQVPLRLAYAITIHKSQGMTLQEAEIDLSRTFEMGQGYVALSRLQSIEGLRLTGLCESALTLDPLAIKADKRFQELSAEIEPRFLIELTKDHTAFLKRCRPTRRHYS